MAEPAASNPNPGPDANPATESNPQSTPNNTSVAATEIDKIVQSATDKVRQELWKEIKKKDTAIEELKKSQMTEAQLRKYKEDQLADQEKRLQRKELELGAVDVLRDSNVPISLRGFFTDDAPKDIEGIKDRAEKFKTEFQKAVEAAVQERFKAAGRDPAKASDPPSGKRSYTRAEVDEISKRVMLPTTSQKERESTMAELQAAMREGRVK